MKKNLNIIQKIIFSFIFMCSMWANAQIEKGVFVTNKKVTTFSIEESYFPEPPIYNRNILLTRLNKNLEKLEGTSGNVGAWRGIKALNDRISADNGTIFYYADITSQEKIKIVASREGYSSAHIPVNIVCGQIQKDKKVVFYFDSLDLAVECAELIYFLTEINDPKIEQYHDSIARADSIQFSIQAAKYREMRDKPAMNEEQRKYIVQANAMNEEKNYKAAIDYFNKAINIDLVAYPAAYYNLALIYAQINDYYYAILNMKKYLLLEPNASDARAAQDKIYKWELYVKQ